MNVTIKDVAKLAGVSTKTVSRVINNQGEISAETRARVQAAIDALAYRPNVLARSLVNQRTNTLAVVAWGIDLFGPSRAVVGVEQQADALGYSLLLNLRCGPDDSNVETVLDSLIARRVDGIIWAIPQVGHNRDWLDPVRLQQLPPIVFLSMEARPGVPVVAVDNCGGAVQAANHLIEAGRRKIGLIAGPLTWWEARERLEGWREALTRAGLDASPSLVAEGDWSAASGESSMKLLLDREPEIEAVFACNDQMALGALGILHQRGRRIPQDVALVGFDNIPESAFYLPPLTTVYQHLIEAGHLAVQKLHQLVQARRNIQNEVGPLSVLLKPDLVVRASSSQTASSEANLITGHTDQSLF